MRAGQYPYDNMPPNAMHAEAGDALFEQPPLVQRRPDVPIVAQQNTLRQLADLTHASMIFGSQAAYGTEFRQ